MSPSLWFVVPVHGRLPLARICLRQLRRTCDALGENGIEATAVIIADRENLDGLGDLHGFGWIVRDNEFLSRRFNDGIQLACDPRFNPRPADFVVPCGSDDWVDYRLFLELPPKDVMYGFRRISFVRPDAREVTFAVLDERHFGGCGIRIYPSQVMAHLRYRPADEDRYRACDTSTLTNLRLAYPKLEVVHRESDPRQIVDWKSEEHQVTPYEAVYARHRGERHTDPFKVLADVFPAEALDEMAAHYGVREQVAA